MICSTVLRLQRRSGVCSAWIEGKRFGFIFEDADKSRPKIKQFVHSSAIDASVKPHRALRVGERVEFELESVGSNGRGECVRVSGPGGLPIEGIDQLPPGPPGGFLY